MQPTPLVSVLMPVYNAEQYLKSSIESILKQTFRDFEFLIFNDASTDNSFKIIASYNDTRIVPFNSDKNKGYVEHLNHGIRIARGQYIARMDADDICAPDRLLKQVEFLNHNPEVGICGTSCFLIRSTGNEGYSVIRELRKEREHEKLVLNLYKENPFIHSSVVLRKNLLVENGLSYDNEYYTAEDYRLWYQVSKLAKLYNLEEPLVYYRLHEMNISKTKKQLQSINANKVRVTILSDRYKMGLTQEEETAIVNFLSQIKIKPSYYRIVDNFFRNAISKAETMEVKEGFYSFFRKYSLWYIEANNFTVKDLIWLKSSFLFRLYPKTALKLMFKSVL